MLWLILILTVETVLLSIVAFQLAAWAQQTPHIRDWTIESPYPRRTGL